MEQGGACSIESQRHTEKRGQEDQINRKKTGKKCVLQKKKLFSFVLLWARRTQEQENKKKEKNGIPFERCVFLCLMRLGVPADAALPLTPWLKEKKEKERKKTKKLKRHWRVYTSRCAATDALIESKRQGDKKTLQTVHLTLLRYRRLDRRIVQLVQLRVV